MIPNDAREATQQQFLAFMCDHLVSLSGTYVCLDGDSGARAEDRFFALSGFILALRGVWCLVTAGHLIEELEEGITAGGFAITNCCLAGHFGSRAAGEQTVPFNLHECGKVFTDDEAAGLDFALLTLGNEQKEALACNGIRPISEENWNRQNIDACELFALLGLPHCLVNNRERLISHGETVAGIVDPVLVPVQRIELPQDEMPESTHPWFVGKVGAASALPDIKGMSGGPIFGFFKGPDGRWQYWIVALQSRWNKERRIIFACPIPVIAQLVEQELQRYANSPQK